MTPDSVIRIFMPVIDAPTHLQLHASLDRWAFTAGDPEPSSNGDDDDKEGKDDQADGATTGNAPPKKSDTEPIFWLDRSAFLAGIGDLTLEDDVTNEKVAPTATTMSELDEGRRRKLKELVDDDWELFAFISRDGSLIVRALTVCLICRLF